MTDLTRQEMTASLAANKAEVDARLANFDASIQTGFAGIRADFAELRTEIANMRTDTVKQSTESNYKVMGVVAAVISAGVAIIGVMINANKGPSTPQAMTPAPIIITIPAVPPASAPSK
jgi:hypothetical protein